MNRDTEGLAQRIASAKNVSPFLNTEQAAFYVLLTKSGLEKMRVRGGGPEFRYHGNKVVYHIDDLEAWSRARKGGGLAAPSREAG